MKIVLIGFSTSGKTTVGKILANKLALDFFDTDELIQLQQGKSISNIFDSCGEQEFRKIENGILDFLCKKDNCVISCGGGSVLCDNFGKLTQDATVIWLKVKPQTVQNRLGDSVRPLLDGKTLQQIEQMVQQRNVLYNNFANSTVIADNLLPEQIAKLIICG